MDRRELTLKYWRYYLLLERRFIDTIQYNELDKKNFKSFSDNYALLMQVIGAELDSLFKVYCGFSNDDHKTIADYVRAIDDEEKNKKPKHAVEHPFRSEVIYIRDYRISIQPFKDWDSNKPGQSLVWWNAFDKLKHNRSNNKKVANQENTLNLLGALFFTEMKMLKKITEGGEDRDVFEECSELFTLKSWTDKVILFEDAFSELGKLIELGVNYKHFPIDV